MRMRHLYAVIATTLAATILSSCYVYSAVPPASNGPAFDEQNACSGIVGWNTVQAHCCIEDGYKIPAQIDKAANEHGRTR